ncbi:hypothetical protein XFUD_09095 [Xylella fastidiosa]|uniref:Uncharacterized protein n=1 Tax=Xylella fastidiosa (strain 9a5c) TaxID=160492 RepID=Q9PBP8_XYLFA|nr:hypothetical protein XF_2092 [Xylella fastidiosa 9a5c]ALQ95275.1 hypothetical protein XFUD_09095 [Xylella fastidiosa]OCA57485.1 hypothetical protein AA93_08915 [Xylella fastidiosa subsp. pauca 11399]OJZ71476.1 hypothetical protein B375_0204330 [Xylella fastidiosa 6c]KXB10553.1 hypothetical protein ADT33_11065 [Xylella fastidiosa]
MITKTTSRFESRNACTCTTSESIRAPTYALLEMTDASNKSADSCNIIRTLLLCLRMPASSLICE